MIVVTALHNPEEIAGPQASGTTGEGPRRAGGRFRKASKLLRSADFQRVYKQGRRQFSARMTVFYLARQEGSGPRVGLTVGRVLGGAVERNRIKRRVREAVRAGLAGLNAPVDVVISPKKSVLTSEFAALKDEVARVFEKIQSTGGGRQPTKAAE